MKDLKGKVALVTGAATGFGKAIVDLLLSRGCKVALLDMDCIVGKQTTAEFQAKYGKDGCIFLRCDVTDDQELDDCFCRTRANFCGLDIVVNNAGIAGEAKWKKIFAINTEAVFSGILLGLKYMGKDNGQKGGDIINVASVAGLRVMPTIPAYNAAKTAVVAMTRAFGDDLYLNRHGVRVNCICPEPMNTPMWWGISAFCKTREDTTAMALDYDKRVMPVEHVARGVLMILDDEKNGTALAALHGKELHYFQFQPDCTSGTGHLLYTMKDFKGKVAIVTGGAMGLGRGIVESLLQKGCKVSILDIDEPMGKQTAADMVKKFPNANCVFYKCDVTNDAQFEDGFKKTKNHFGGIDILVNNAGIAGEDQWRKVFSVNLEAYYSGILLAMKYMDKSKGGKGGHVVNVSSVSGIYVLPQLPAYNTSQAAIVTMTRCFGSDMYYSRTGVKVYCICPDPIDTRLWAQLSDYCRMSEETVEYAHVYDTRIQQPVVVAHAIIQLLEDEKNGGIMLCLHKIGNKYHEFPVLPDQ
nr:uncharacterized short-chain type dehydrogenase/reductase y4vI-like [Rhipicephalus microplus]